MTQEQLPWDSLFNVLSFAFIKGGGVRLSEPVIAPTASSSTPCTPRTRRFCSNLKQSHITKSSEGHRGERFAL